MNNRQILTVVTGSRLHGLHQPNSDTDYRGVFMNTLEDILNPFVKPDDTCWIEGTCKDDTSYELRKFVKEAVHGNPNFIEILFSNIVVNETDEGKTLRANAWRFIDSKRIFEAFKGYSNNQLNKMELFTPDARTPKFAVAYIRSLLNGLELLVERTITNPVPQLFILPDGYHLDAREILLKIKCTPYTEFDKVRNLCTNVFSRLQVALGEAFYQREPYCADIDWIVDFTTKVYKA